MTPFATIRPKDTIGQASVVTALETLIAALETQISAQNDQISAQKQFIASLEELTRKQAEMLALYRKITPMPGYTLPED